MRIKSKTPICDKAEKFLINRREVVYLHVAQKLEKSLIRARKELKVTKEKLERIQENIRQQYYAGW